MTPEHSPWHRFLFIRDIGKAEKLSLFWFGQKRKAGSGERFFHISRTATMLHKRKVKVGNPEGCSGLTICFGGGIVVPVDTGLQDSLPCRVATHTWRVAVKAQCRWCSRDQGPWSGTNDSLLWKPAC